MHKTFKQVSCCFLNCKYLHILITTWFCMYFLNSTNILRTKLIYHIKDLKKSFKNILVIHFNKQKLSARIFWKNWYSQESNSPQCTIFFRRFAVSASINLNASLSFLTLSTAGRSHLLHKQWKLERVVGLRRGRLLRTYSRGAGLIYYMLLIFICVSMLIF